MYWNQGKLFHFKSLSLVTKLMLFYSLSTIGILSSISLFLYPTFLKIIEKINQSEASHVTAECYQQVILTLLFASLSAILIGHFIARKGLKSLREFETKIEQITVDSLHKRVNLNDWPKELSALGKKFNTMLDRLESSFIQISQFSSDIAHELRNPINNLRGLTEITLEQHGHEEKYRILLEKYMQEYHHLSKLIENLLFFARSDNGQIMLAKERLDTKKEVLNICDYYQAIADENNTAIECEGNSFILADLTLFKRVISNLLSNALHYTKNGKIIIKIRKVDQHTEIGVHDTGIGISAEHLPKICDRFYRVDASRFSQSGSIGVGLAIVKSIIGLHKGNLRIESQVNVGTSVYLTVPDSSFN